jgi:predicted AlkP superfamily pyrophosphatase or phosphodiesterase
MLVAAASAACAGATTAPQEADPAVVVMISVDQLRADLITRYDRFYTGGFRRLIDEGAYFDAVHDHAISETAPGHAALSTGTIPARNGIVANEWLHRSGDDWVQMYTVEDSTAPIVGFPEQDGMSPRNLLRSGLADWLVEQKPEAKVVSIAGKDRSAVLMAAHVPGLVYWYDTGSRRFITSTYYRADDAPWVTRFNDEVLPSLLDSAWTATAPAAANALARPDTAQYEANGENTFFPHRYADESDGGRRSFSGWVERTPFPDLAVVEVAKLAVRETGLGDDGVTDFLAVGLSQPDRVGHYYGPLSREQLENLLHADRVLGDLFRFLDEEVGEGRWVAAMSADHGALTMPEWRTAHGEPGARLTREIRQQMSDATAAARAAAPSGQEAEAEARALTALPFLAGGYTREEIASGTPRDSIVRLLRNSYHPDRMKSELARRGVIAIGLEGTYMSTATTGSGHGTPYYYDRSVPLIFLGAGVEPGRRTELARTVDLAPTLAGIAGITAPDDLDGELLVVSAPR